MIDQQKARQLTTILSPLLKAGSVDSLDYLEELRTLPGTEDLICAIDNFEFAQAAKYLQKWMEREQ